MDILPFRNTLPQIFTAIFATAFCCTPSYAQDKYLPHIDLGGYYFTHTPHDAGFMGLFLPVAQDPHNLLYADIRGIFKTHGGNSKEGNFGLAFRHLSPSENYMYGVYGFYDRKKTTTANYFSQATVGMESWFNRLFAGLNYYQPTGSRSIVTNNSNSITGALTSISSGVFNILLSQTQSTSYEVVMVGGDATLGYQVTDHLESFAGSYYFHASTNKISVPSTLGALCKLRYGFFRNDGHLLFGAFEQITLEGQLQYDHLGGVRLYAGARFGIGVGPAKLSMMQRHMVEQSLRDIDLVVEDQTVTSNRKFIAQADTGLPISVQQVTNTTEFDSAIGDTSIDIIAVQGTISNANAAAQALATGQTVTGKFVTLTVDNSSVAVQVSSGGQLIGASGQNILKVAKNNVVRDITLTTLNPPTSGGNKAIYADTTVNDLGLLTVYNVNSNAIIEISRTGAAQQGSVLISNSTFSSPSSWNPTDLPGMAQFDIATSATLNVTLINNTLEAFASTQQIVGAKFTAATSSTITIEAINNNVIKGTDSGVDLGVSNNSSIIVNGDIANNTISGGSTALTDESGIDIFCSLTAPGTVHVKGAIKNNNITGTGNAVNIEIFNAASAAQFNFDMGFQNNTMSSTTDSVFLEASNTVGTVVINNLYGNSLTPAGGNFGFHLAGAHTTILVGQGASTGLSAANNGASVSVTGATIIPGQ